MTLEARIAAWRRREAERYANPNALTKEEVTLSVWNHITRTREDFLAGMEAAAKVDPIEFLRGHLEQSLSDEEIDGLKEALILETIK